MNRKEKIEYLKGVAAGTIQMKQGEIFDPLYVSVPGVLKMRVLQPGEERMPGFHYITVCPKMEPVPTTVETP